MPWGRLLAIVGAGTAAILFAAYCVYYDRKRRSSHDYKARLREKRLHEQREKAAGSMRSLSNIRDVASIEQFYSNQLHIGNDLLAIGDLNGASEHLCNAIVVSPDPDELLVTLRAAVGPEPFQRLLEQLPAARKRLKAALYLNTSTI